MKLSYDLHIHSALSPCGDGDMTPNNIVNMAYLKGLDVIAVTDHNSVLNIKPVISLAKKYDILVIPGIEITTKEDIHVLGYFKDFNNALNFYEVLYNSIPNIKNEENIFGKQLVLDEGDNLVSKEEKLLISSTNLSIKEVFNLIVKFDGIGVPAHINKVANSIITTLGFIPMDIDVKTVEVSKKGRKINDEKLDKKYNIITNSDAHYLKDISEPENILETEEKTIDYVFKALTRRNNC